MVGQNCIEKGFEVDFPQGCVREIEKKGEYFNENMIFENFKQSEKLLLLVYQYNFNTIFV